MLDLIPGLPGEGGGGGGLLNSLGLDSYISNVWRHSAYRYSKRFGRHVIVFVN